MFIEYQNRSRTVERRARVCVCVGWWTKRKIYKEAEKCLSFLSYSFSAFLFFIFFFFWLSTQKYWVWFGIWRTGFWRLFVCVCAVVALYVCMYITECLCRQDKSAYRINFIEWTMEELLWDQLYICTTYEWTMLSLEGVKKFTLLEMFISRRPFRNWNTHANTHKVYALA